MSDRIPFYAHVSDAQWSDWRWQQRHRITRLENLEQVIRLTDTERRACVESASRFRMAITPYYAELMDPADPNCPIRRQAVPTMAEMELAPGECDDPLAEERYMPVPGLTHRYPDRALIYATHNCPVYCRFCTRKRKVSNPDSAPEQEQLRGALDYIRRTPEIRDVILSGGDPLSLSNRRIAALLDALAGIAHVDVVRIATRNLVTLPQRIDSEFCSVLREFQGRHLAIYVMTHFNHLRECTDAAWTACEKVIGTGTPIQNQMVLLRGINDEAAGVAELNRQLLRMRVKPYYILHADMVAGISHFRTTLAVGRQLMAGLRGHISGLAVPQYVVDLPGGGGKVSLQADYLVESGPDGHRFRNYRGDTFFLPEESSGE
jgi:lysine 2,3-aminomutase